MNDLIKRCGQLISTLPNLGPRSARRIAIHLAQNKEQALKLSNYLKQIYNLIKKCSVCNNLSENNICNICSDDTRDQNQICIIEQISDLFAIEQLQQYEGVYHIIETDNAEQLINRINDDQLKECIIATNATIEGQATTHFIQSVLQDYKNVTITSLALGLPMGSNLDYQDSGTISIALTNRKEV